MTKKKPRVVLVDDSETVLAASRSLLEAAGLEVTSVAAPIGATLKVLETMPDLVVTDVNMKTMPGDRVVARIKQSPRMGHIPVLLYSERSERELAEIAKRCGADGYIAKASGPREFTARIVEQLNVRQKVLVVDDSASVLAACALTLEGAGFDVSTTASPASVQRKLEREPPDVILMDVTMPVLSGDELVRRLKQDSKLRGIPVFLYSERPEKELKALAQKCGADGYVHKSQSNEDLVERLRDSMLQK